jgi:hypothetical protein
VTKRQLIINSYRTAEDGLFTLTSLKITKASQVQTFVSVPGRFAPLNLSTALTDGQPYYGNASLEAVLESSEGTRAERQERIDYLVNLLDGYSVQIIHPDHPAHYLVGGVQVHPEYNDLVHCRVKVSAVCEPWFYSADTIRVTRTATASAQPLVLSNSGRLAVVPTIEVVGEITLTYGGITKALSTGVHQLPDLYLTTGQHSVEYRGTGTVAFTYREAVLAE